MRPLRGLCLRSGASLPMLPLAAQPCPGAVWERRGAGADLLVKRGVENARQGQTGRQGQLAALGPGGHGPTPRGSPRAPPPPHGPADEGGCRSCALQHFSMFFRPFY